jgi:glycosyltransferase involved in cell wall biosynthesis
VRSFMGFFYSLDAKKNLKEMLNEIQVDVAHVHNIYGRLTTSVLDCFRKAAIPIVMTLHDYKVICPSYKMMHHNRICEDCKGHKYYMAILNRCHKDSIIASTIYAVETYFNYIFKKYIKNVQYFISPSKFMKAKLIEFGFPETHIEYIPNFLSISDFEPNFIPGEYFLFLGRLSSEKGIGTLIKAFTSLRHHDMKLIIVGEGPMEDELKRIAGSDTRIKFSGYLSGAPLAEITKNALAVVVPSEWYENAPLSILEAMAYGKPVIGSAIGGIPEMIEDGHTGFLFEAGNVNELRKKLLTIFEMQKDDISRIGQSARWKVEKEYNAEVHYDRLMALYQRAVSGS